jgi:hypothetical protein
LQDFSEISGLHCNYDKTALLPMNPVTEEERIIILESGFKQVESIKLLGAVISSDWTTLPDNFIGIVDKIKKLISFWSRFRLSLPGRISIAKTYLLSQLNYLGSILTPGREILSNIKTLIHNFIRKNLQISDIRIRLTVDQGGLGFFDLHEFMLAQKCTWIFRAKKFPIDNWRYDVHLLAPNYDPLLIRSSDVPRESYPILFDLASAYEIFYGKYCKMDANFKHSIIFENEVFRDGATGSTISANFFGRNFYNLHKDRIRSLTYDNCIVGNSFKSVNIFAADGLPFTLNMWMRLQNIILSVKHTFRNVKSVAASVPVPHVVDRWKKGCKKFRTILGNDTVVDNDPIFSRSFITFKNLTSCVPINGTFIYDWLTTWNINNFPNEFRSFIFNCRYNYLPTNNRLNSYIKEIDPRCSFCLHLDKDTVQRDSFGHCLFTCNTVRGFIINFLSEFDFSIGINDEGFPNLYWYGIYKEDILTKSRHSAFTVIFDAFRFVIYKCRRDLSNTNDHQVVEETKYLLLCLCKFNPNFKRKLLGIPELARLMQAIG